MDLTANLAKKSMNLTDKINEFGWIKINALSVFFNEYDGGDIDDKNTFDRL